MRPFFLTLTCWVFCYVSFAQQKENTREIKLFFEKVYLHTDREVYAAGEDLWCSAYLVNAQSGRLTSTSKTLYVDLVSPANQVVLKKIFRLSGGRGHGDFRLSDSLPAGNYRIRGYTSWMRNFDDKFIFEKKIRVYSADIPEKEPQATRLKNSLRFFPEGGSMVDGVEGLVAFKAETPGGKGLKMTGTIESTSGDPAGVLFSDTLGFGSLVLRPEPGKRYLAKGTFADGSSFSELLPIPLQQGFAIHINRADSLLSMLISADEQTVKEYLGRKMLVACNSKGKRVYTATVTVTGQRLILKIPLAGFLPGISSVILLDETGRSHCERLVFTEFATQTPKLSVALNKAVYGPKEKVDLTIRLADTTGAKGEIAGLSVAVVDAGAIPDDEVSIVSYLELQSEVKGYIENAASYFNEGDPTRLDRIDLLLLTQGWRDFLWKRVADSIPLITRIPESGLTVSGTVRTLSGKRLPMPGMNVTLTAWGAVGNKLYTTSSDSTGRFFFDGLDLPGNQYLQFTSTNAKGKPDGFLMIDTAAFAEPTVNKLPYTVLPPAPTFAAESAKRVSIGRRLSLSDTLELNAVELTAGRKGWVVLTDTVLSVKRADYSYKYLFQYLGARVPGAKVQRSDYVVFTYPRYDQKRYHPYPMYTDRKPYGPRFDRRRQYYMDYLQKDYLHTPVSQINSVRLIRTRTHNLVESETFGLPVDYINIFIDAKPGAFTRQGYRTAGVDVDGYDEPRVFFEPNYRTPTAKQDVRTTIFWNPEVKLEPDGTARLSWYNSDPKTKVRVVLQGLTAGGQPFVATSAYRVN